MVASWFRTRLLTPPSIGRALLELALRQDRSDRDAKALSSMSDEQLKDIGISRSDAEREARALGWNAPNHWQNRP